MAQTFPYRPMRPVAALREVVTNPYRLRYYAGRVILYAILFAGAILVTIPFIWLVSSSLKPQAQLVAFPPIWIPKPILWENYPKALTALPFSRFILNTVIIATGQLLAVWSAAVWGHLRSHGCGGASETQSSLRSC